MRSSPSAERKEEWDGLRVRRVWAWRAEGSWEELSSDDWGGSRQNQEVRLGEATRWREREAFSVRGNGSEQEKGRLLGLGEQSLLLHSLKSLRSCKWRAFWRQKTPLGIPVTLRGDLVTGSLLQRSQSSQPAPWCTPFSSQKYLCFSTVVRGHT